MRPHRDVALDQLRNADNLRGDPEDGGAENIVMQHQRLLVGALVHAILDMGDAMRCEPELDPVWDLTNGTKDT